jgi:dienelactone hydrolase
MACGGPVTPIALPDNPAETGLRVGVTTVTQGESVLEVWYPASEDTSPTGELAPMMSFIPANVVDAMGPTFGLPDVPTLGVRDAVLLDANGPYPVVVFSHGFGGMRVQSVGLTSHLASRGYVVIAPDHPGRMLGDVLPCLFMPALDGCDLLGMFGGDDPAEVQVADALIWMDGAAVEGRFAGMLDTQQLGLFGHSAGGMSTATVGQQQPRFKALLGMAGFGEVARDVPTQILSGTCDAVVTNDSLLAIQASDGGELFEIHGAGHQAFADICALDLAAMAETYLAGRDDVNTTILDQMMLLGVDGCPGYVPDPPPSEDCATDYLPLGESDVVIRHLLTDFFDVHLKGSTSIEPDFAVVTAHR